MQTSAICYQCYVKDEGFVASGHSRNSGWTFTQDRSKAKIYKSKHRAAKSLYFKTWNSPEALERLSFFEVEIVHIYR